MAVRNTKNAQELIRKWQEDWSGKGLPLNIEVCCLSLNSSTSRKNQYNFLIYYKCLSFMKFLKLVLVNLFRCHERIVLNEIWFTFVARSWSLIFSLWILLHDLQKRGMPAWHHYMFSSIMLAYFQQGVSAILVSSY